eukprot:365234-Chlamydomonas_euryale.AAC.9
MSAVPGQHACTRGVAVRPIFSRAHATHSLKTCALDELGQEGRFHAHAHVSGCRRPPCVRLRPYVVVPCCTRVAEVRTKCEHQRLVSSRAYGRPPSGHICHLAPRGRHAWCAIAPAAHLRAAPHRSCVFLSRSWNRRAPSQSGIASPTFASGAGRTPTRARPGGGVPPTYKIQLAIQLATSEFKPRP